MGGVAILYWDASNLKVEQHRVTDGPNGSSHQAVSWMIKSPLIARPIHITGVYVSPSEGEIEEFFHTLTQQNHYPANDIHIYVGAFNAHVADETETHISMQERHTIPSRVGDCHKRHMPSPPAAAPITNTRISSPQRGWLLLRMLNTTSFLILNGRFEGADGFIPYTLQRQDEATVNDYNDYNLIAKQYFPKVKTCYVIPRPLRSPRSKSGPSTNHNPIVLHLLAKSATQSTANIPIAQELPPRTQFHLSKLKDPAVRKKHSHALEDQADKAEQAIQTLKKSLQQGGINATQYAEKANAIIVSALQVTAQKIIGTTEFRGKNAQREHLTQRRQHDNWHFSADDKRIVAKQTLTLIYMNSYIFRICFIAFILWSYLIFDFVCLTLSSADTHGIAKYARTYMQDTHTYAHTHKNKK